MPIEGELTLPPITIRADGLGGFYVVGHWPALTRVAVNVEEIREALGMVAPHPLRDGVKFNVDNGRADYEVRRVQPDGLWVLELRFGELWWPFQPRQHREYRMIAGPR
jgi:hypothetical protein